MRTVITLMAAMTLAASAQTNAPSGAKPSASAEPTADRTGGGQTNSIGGMATNQPTTFTSPWMVVPFGIWSTAKHSGAGVSLLYELTPNLVLGGRLDYLNGAIWMPSLNLQLQAPFRISKGLTLVPLTFTGAAMPLGSGSGSATPILGAGLAVRLGTRVDIVADVERWTGMDGIQFRAGVIWKF